MAQVRIVHELLNNELVSFDVDWKLVPMSAPDYSTIPEALPSIAFYCKEAEQDRCEEFADKLDELLKLKDPDIHARALRERPPRFNRFRRNDPDRTGAVFVAQGNGDTKIALRKLAHDRGAVLTVDGSLPPHPTPGKCAGTRSVKMCSCAHRPCDRGRRSVLHQELMRAADAGRHPDPRQ